MSESLHGKRTGRERMTVKSGASMGWRPSQAGRTETNTGQPPRSKFALDGFRVALRTQECG
eukprot:8905924-Alexandrium_andersonii.AAC.1